MGREFHFWGVDRMKVFISWSGDTSFKVAEVLKEWVPCIIQDVEPYFSSADIDKDARWSSDIAKELEAADFGILCVTKDNIDSSWLNFEAGALSKAIDKARVCPFLFDLSPSDISKSPILQFQMTNVDRDDIYKLFQSINSCLGNRALEEERLKKTFDLSWSALDTALQKISNSNKSNRDKTPDNSKNINGDISAYKEILEEMLNLLRTQQILLRDPEQLLPEKYMNFLLSNVKRNIRPSDIPTSLARRLRLAEEAVFEYSNNSTSDAEYISALKDYFEIARTILQELGIRYKGPYKF